MKEGTTIEKRLQNEKNNTYDIELKAGEFLDIEVEQKGIDLGVVLCDPEGKVVLKTDSPNDEYGPEPVLYTAEKGGIYKVKVESLQETLEGGNYEIKVKAVRLSTEGDKIKLRARQLFLEAEALQLHAQKLTDSLSQENIYRKAIEKYKESLAVYEKIEDYYWVGCIYDFIGTIYHLELGELNEGLDYFSKGLEARIKHNDRLGQSISLNNIGLIYEQKGEKETALTKYNEALNLWEKSLLTKAAILSNLGKVLTSLGKREKVLQYYTESVQIFRNKGDQKGASDTVNNIGIFYFLLGHDKKALDYYSQSVVIKRQLDNADDLLESLHNLGAVHVKIKQAKEALPYFNEALQIAKRKEKRAVVLTGLALAHYSLGEVEKALSYCKESLAIWKTVDKDYTTVETFEITGRVYYSIGNRKEALSYYNQAEQMYKDSADLRGQANILYHVAQIDSDLGKYEEAKRKIEKAIEIIEKLRSSVLTEELRISYFESVHDYYAFYVELLMKLHQKNPNKGYDIAAFEASERSRARSLVDLINEAKVNIYKGADPELIKQKNSLEERFRDRLDTIRRLKGGEAKVLEKEVDNLTVELGQIEAKIKQTSPDYAALTQPEPMNLKQMQQEIDEDTVVLEYMLGKKNSYVWAVTNSSINSYKLPKEDEINETAREVYRAITNVEADKAGDKYLKIAEKLSEMVLKPIKEIAQKKVVVVVADGALQYITFAALPNSGSQKWLLLTHETVVEPSLSSLSLLRKRIKNRQPQPSLLFMVGDPVFNREDIRVKKGKQEVEKAIFEELQGVTSSAVRDVYDSAQLSRLPYSRDEVSVVKSLVDPNQVKVLLDFDANLDEILNSELSKYRYIHFASHGLFNSNNPKLSGIVFSQVDKEGNLRKSFLGLTDIFNLKLTADMVVLSACQTGLGKEIKGEGIVGFTQGFMYAGSARIISSLWNANDATTAKLMKEFYRQILKENKTPSEALRAAQLKMINSEFSHPFYWAGFVLQGEWR
ncbi:MAG: CHAT domain-containing protein [Blastocatellia bacterium]|nr:CHAT domain-containing protein [Blastocatellia bacterium]